MFDPVNHPPADSSASGAGREPQPVPPSSQDKAPRNPSLRQPGFFELTPGRRKILARAAMTAAAIVVVFGALMYRMANFADKQFENERERENHRQAEQRAHMEGMMSGLRALDRKIPSPVQREEDKPPVAILEESADSLSTAESSLESLKKIKASKESEKLRSQAAEAPKQIRELLDLVEKRLKLLDKKALFEVEANSRDRLLARLEAIRRELEELSPSTK